MSAPDSAVALHWRMKFMRHLHSMVLTIGAVCAIAVKVVTIPRAMFPLA
jgi:hypothetical protein